jgi:hypothetical protein
MVRVVRKRRESSLGDPQPLLQPEKGISIVGVRVQKEKSVCAFQIRLGEFVRGRGVLKLLGREGEVSS